MKIIKSTKNIEGKYPITSSTKNIAGASKSNVRATAYTNRAILKYKNKSFTIYDNSDSINLPADADFEALRKWKAQISQQAGPYNDADEDYEWASLFNGVVSYYRRGKLVDKSYYMSPSDWGVETLEEWFQLVINDVIENLYEANRDVPDHMVYNSTDIENSSDDNIFIEDIIDGLEDNGYDLDDLSSIKEGLWSLFGYQGKDADDVIQDLVAGGFVDSNVLIDSGRKSIYSDTEEDGEGYWFFTTHGVQPGSVPRDVDILDIIDTPNGSFVKFDRFLSTEELNKYDMKERAPKSVMSAESIGIEHYPDDDIEMSTFSDKNDVTSSTIKTSYEVELDPEESMIDMNIDQYIIVDSEGSWEYDSDNYDWASSDGQGSDWYSDNGVRLDDPTGVVEKIDELIEPHIPIEPGTYRVQGYIELYYTVSGVYENRYDYTSDDYSSDINSDLGSAEYNKKLSKIEDIKVTKI